MIKTNLMKKSLVLIISFVIFSCSKNDDNQQSQDLIGKWDLKSHITGTTNDPLDYCEQLYSGYEFKTNGTCIDGYGRLNANVCTNNQYNQTYTFVNNILSVKEINGFEARYNVIELSSTKLKLTQTYSKEIDNGTVYEHNLTASEQITSSYDRI
jgi:hypothetical protein